MLQSLVKKAEQGGWMPIFPGWNSYTSEMIGDHVISVMSDAILKRINSQHQSLPSFFDVESGYHYLNQNCFEEPDTFQEYSDGKGRRALKTYEKYGYIPLEDPVKESPHTGEQVSRTLEYSYDDFAMYQLSVLLNASFQDLGITQNSLDQLEERATFWRNVFDPEYKLVRGRHADGSWSEPYDPTYDDYGYITEGTPWQYSWFVPHDVAGLITEMGGDEIFVSNLTQFFDQHLYNHGNEPGHHVYFLYNYASGWAWKTQSVVRNIIREQYTTGPYGLPGNDDAGQMSAWLIFAGLGFYPVSPGIFPVYVLTSPLYQSAKIQVSPNLYFTVQTYNNSATNVYIEKTLLNGKAYNKGFISHQDIMSGSTLEIYLSAQPNRDWGTEEVPPSMSKMRSI
eukprot:TRINITY_DN1465_c0_g1_i2.p1 TRINITY_DN1465_c0_g1~~TRINITY_DN1465_c0_g1_i2.p1  ORF type:complete len:395 (-),score=58.07 TRINITY_DN1465_c0_g1_i2:39-1223(-)